MVGKQKSVMAYRARQIIAFKAKVASIADVKMTDPVHDALLHLYVAEEEGMVMSVSAVAPLMRVPQSTWLRHMASMEEAGLIVRTQDPLDMRRGWLKLSRSCKARLDEFIADFW